MYQIQVRQGTGSGLEVWYPAYDDFADSVTAEAALVRAQQKLKDAQRAGDYWLSRRELRMVEISAESATDFARGIEQN